MVSANASSPHRRRGLSIVKEDVPLYLWSAYVLTFPLYFFPSGALQISAFFLLATLWAYLLLPVRLTVEPFKAPFLMLMTFYVYSSAVNFSMWLVYHDYRFLLTEMFNTYNVITFLLGIALYQNYGPRFLKVTIYSSLAALVACVVLSPLAPPNPSRDIGARQVFFFNDPNQFGYLCILVSTLHLIGSRFGLVRRGYALTVIAGAAAISTITISRGAVAAMGVLGLMAFPLRVTIPAALIMVAAVTYFYEDIPLLQAFEKRLELIESHPSADLRNGERIAENPGYLLLGAGEGAYQQRFHDSQEIHSMLPNIAFSYGIPGIMMIGFFIYLIVRDLNFVNILALFSIAFYNLFENGFRFTMVWIVLVFLAAAGSWRKFGYGYNRGFPRTGFMRRRVATATSS